jgi:hypothetical protein
VHRGDVLVLGGRADEADAIADRYADMVLRQVRRA